MEAPLESLHVELVECIVTYLEPSDIFSLRLTSHTMEEKASQGSFTTFFKHKSIKLTAKTLQELVRMTSQGRLGCYLEYCTIAGIARDEVTAADEDTDEHLCLLSEAFRNLKQRSAKGSLASVCLRVTLPDQEEGDVDLSENEEGESTKEEGEELDEKEDEAVINSSPAPSWRAVWAAALRTFKLTVAALNESQLTVHEHLDIFGSLRGCSLIRDAFLEFAQGFPSMHVFAFLKKLTVSLSLTPIPKDQEYNPDSDNENWTPVDKQALLRDSLVNPQDILQVLRRIMPDLESLELHWYNVEGGVSRAQFESVTLQESNTDSACTKSLKECILHGIYVSENNLLNFLVSIHPARVILTNIHLTIGTYASIFQYITGLDSPVTYYHLDDLREGRKLVHYDGVLGLSKFPYSRESMGPSTLTRHNVTEDIRYRLPTSRSVGSGARYRWILSKSMGFGPPNKYNYDLKKLNSTPDPGSPLNENCP